MNDEKMVGLEEFVAHAKVEIDKFAYAWNANRLHSPEMFPDRLLIGEWWEQLWVTEENL